MAVCDPNHLVRITARMTEDVNRLRGKIYTITNIHIANLQNFYIGKTYVDLRRRHNFTRKKKKSNKGKTKRQKRKRNKTKLQQERKRRQRQRLQQQQQQQQQYVSLNPQNPQTWKKTGINRSWRTYRGRRDGMIVIAVIRENQVPRAFRQQQQNNNNIHEAYTLTLKERLIEHYREYDNRCGNRNNQNGRRCQIVHPGYVLFITYTCRRQIA